MDLIVDVENGVVSSSKEIPTIQNLATATSTATLCTEPSVSRAPSVTTLGNNASDTLNALESAFTYYTGALWHEFTSEFETDLLIWKQMQHSGCDAHEPIKLGLYWNYFGDWPEAVFNLILSANQNKWPMRVQDIILKTDLSQFLNSLIKIAMYKWNITFCVIFSSKKIVASFSNEHMIQHFFTFILLVWLSIKSDPAARFF